MGPNGISIGGRNGIYVGPAGIRIGSSGGAYAEQEQTTGLIDQAWIFSATEHEGGTAVREDDGTVIQNIELGAFDRIEANIDLGDITVIQDGDGYFLEFRNNEDGYELNYRFDGSTLIIDSVGEKRTHWGNGNTKVSVTILVPAGSGLKDLDLHGDLGDIYVGEFDQTIPKAALKTDLGDVTWWNSAVKELSAESALGNVTVILPDMGEVAYTLSTSLGEVILNDRINENENVNYHPKQYDCFVEAHSDLGDEIGRAHV